MSETIYAQWTVDRAQHRIWVVVVTAVATVAFLTTFFLFYIVSATTNIVLVTVPILLFLLWLGILPEALKAWNNVSENGQVYVTEKGVYSRDLADPNKYKFVSWENIAQYDLKYFNSVSFLGNLFARPTRFFLKGRYEEDSFAVDALGENADVLRAYLKEKNVTFGFVKK